MRSFMGNWLFWTLALIVFWLLKFPPAVWLMDTWVGRLMIGTSFLIFLVPWLFMVVFDLGRK